MPRRTRRPSSWPPVAWGPRGRPSTRRCAQAPGKERIVVTAKGGMSIWREHIFAFLSKNAENAADFFQLPPDRVYEVSQVVEI